MDRQQQHTKVERFLKLGYSHGDIVRVLESLHHDAQTNDILEELIKTCHTVPNSPKLVARGCSPGPSQPRPGADREAHGGFRPVVIDGSNVAMSHGDKKVFSCLGLQLAVNWFWDKGLRDITVFVPLWRKEQPRPEAPITDQHVLHELERRKILVYTPSRCVNGKRVVCYDDRYIVKLACDSDGIIVSNDNYRDLQTENPQWKKFIEERLLMYSFANDNFMPPDDPLGRNGPTIDDFLRKKPWTADTKLQHCPYGKKCTYGVKCKFYHPERANQSQLSVADELRAQRDRAKTSPKCSLPDTPRSPSVYQLDHRYTSSAPPTLSTEDWSHRTSPGEQFVYQRDSGSPRAQPNVSFHDVDEAFGSLDSSMSQVFIQNPAYSTERLLHSHSSGVACSYSLSHDDYSLPGSYGGSTQTPGRYPPPTNGAVPCERHVCTQYAGWGSCPALPPHNRDRYSQFSEKQHLRPHTHRLSHSLPRDPWVQSGLSDAGLVKSPSSERRKGLRSQLSTLFPHSTVEQVMNAYPHVSDMLELISLIQSYNSNRISY